MPSPRHPLAFALLAALATTACTTDDDGAPTMTTTPSPEAVRTNGTTLQVERRGHGSPLLLVHGGGEDASMLAAQADSLAAAGFQVITYDRRGTGGSGREDWPSRGADQHADDAAALLDALQLGPTTVVGVSSGGVIALDMAVRHPEAVERVVAWEPPAAGIVPDGAAITAAIMEPVEAHLAANPDDFVGVQAILLSAILGFTVAPDDPAFESARANAEPLVRDEPAITLAALDLDALATRDITVAIGSAPNDVVAGAVEILAATTGRAPIVVDADHEVYLTDPSVLTAIVTAAAQAAHDSGAWQTASTLLPSGSRTNAP